jgi:hypothetical protein
MVRVAALRNRSGKPSVAFDEAVATGAEEQIIEFTIETALFEKLFRLFYVPLRVKEQGILLSLVHIKTSLLFISDAHE